MCQKQGFEFSWMDAERERMCREAIGHLGGKAWQDRLQALQEEGGDLEVPEGFCRVGCGRRVAPGVTRAGRPFATCCRGCVMGFGHDQRCGQIDPTKAGKEAEKGVSNRHRPFHRAIDLLGPPSVG